MTDLLVVGSAGKRDPNATWEIRAVGMPRLLSIIQLGTVPPGYEQIGRQTAPYESDLFLLSAVGSGRKVAAGVGSSSDPQRQVMVGGIIAGQKHAASHCYPVP